MICENIIQYKQYLEENLNGDEIKQILNSDKVENIFDKLILEPLNNCKEENNKIIVIDALDELTKNAKISILNLISEHFIKLPKWIKIFLTSREDSIIKTKLNKFNPEYIKCDEKRNRQDLRIYLNHIASRYIKDEISVEIIEDELEKKYNKDFKGSMNTITDLIKKQKDAYVDAKKGLENLNKIKSISELRPSTLKQLTNDYSQLRKDAEECQKMLHENSLLSEWKESFGEMNIPKQIKGDKRCKEKAHDDYGDDFSRLVDLARCSFIFDNCDDMVNAFDKLSSMKEFEIVRIKNKFKYPTPVGYSDLNLNIKWNNKHIFEVQLHLKSIIGTKNDICHEYYEGKFFFPNIL